MRKSRRSKPTQPTPVKSLPAAKSYRAVGLLLAVLLIAAVLGMIAWRSTTQASPHADGTVGASAAAPTGTSAATTATAPAAAPAASMATPPPTPAGGFQPTVENKQSPAQTAPAGMVWIPGGEFSMGAQTSDTMNDVGMKATLDSRPVHRVYVDGFWMDKTDVTNAEFARFVKATGYVTVAERKPRAEDFPGAPPENLVAGAVVFAPPDHAVSLDDHLQWWTYVPGANWRHPEGPQTDLKGRGNFPVVDIAYEDALAYAKWAGKRLPTEAQWEFAARGGLSGKLYPWGDEFRPGGKWMANTHQGSFPVTDTGDDGHVGISAVALYPPNGYGLYDMAGDVWQWTSDWYRPDYYARLMVAGGTARNPQGPTTPYDPNEPTEKKKVQRGGSFLCTDQYCSRYIVGTRGKGEISTGTNHLGFRCVSSPEHKTSAIGSQLPRDRGTLVARESAAPHIH